MRNVDVFPLRKKNNADVKRFLAPKLPVVKRQSCVRSKILQALYKSTQGETVLMLKHFGDHNFMAILHIIINLSLCFSVLLLSAKKQEEIIKAHSLFLKMQR